MPGYENIPMEELIQLVKTALPPEEVRIGHTYEQDRAVCIDWHDLSFKVYHNLMVREATVESSGVYEPTDTFVLMEFLLDNTKQMLDAKLTDPDDRYWHIECRQLETERMKAEAQLNLSKIGLAEAEAERMKAETALLETQDRIDALSKARVTCTCGAELEFSCSDGEEIRYAVNNFVDEHSSCR